MAKSWTFNVRGSADKLFAATVKAISDLGYSITHSDAGSKTVSFETGMSWRTWKGQEMSAAVSANGDVAELVVSAGRKSGQLVEWGEKESIAQRIYEKVLEVTPNMSDAPYATAERAAEASPVSTAAELEKLAKLHESGALTSEEFSAAKAKLLG
jgi:hypothetical protein